MDGLRLELFGGLQLRSGATGAVVPIASRKAAALLAFLALRPGQPQPRERLAGLLWGNSAEEQARPSLRQALATLRRASSELGAALENGCDAVALRAGTVRTDVEQFEAALAANTPEALAAAAALYRGDLLDGYCPRSEAFEAWLVPERERLRARAIVAMRALLDRSSAAADAAGHAALALRLLALDPAQEEVHRALMGFYLRQGRHNDALRQYQACRAALRREVDADPEAETERLHCEIRKRRLAAGVQHRGAAEGTPGTTASASAGSPSEPTPAVPAATATAATAELRHAAAVLAELVDASQVQADPETAHCARAELLAVVQRAAQRHGGRAEAVPGTAAVAVFGLPTAHGDDPARGVRAALDIRSMARESGCDALVAFGVRASVVYGAFVVGGSSPEDGATAALVGGPLEEARRLAALAGKGQIIVSGEIQRAVPDVACVAVDGDGAAEGKGGSGWILLGSSPARHDAAPPPLVGRRAELGQLAATIDALEETGRGGTVAVRGEPGVGKTRLVEEFQRLAADRGLRCHAVRFLDGDAPGAVPALLRALLDAAAPAEEDAAAAARRLARRLVAEGCVAERDRAALEDLMGSRRTAPGRAAAPPEPADEAGRDGTRREMVGAALGFAGSLQPRLIVAEDMHRADPQSLADLSAIAAAAANSRAILVTTTRRPGMAGPSGDLAGAAPLVTMDLAPLHRDACMAIARHGGHADEPFVRTCVDRAGGNPFFLHQLLRDPRRDGTGLPATVRSTVLMRLDALDARDRRALQAASVLGQRFAEQALRYLLDDPGYSCAPLVAHALLAPCREGYAFPQAVVRDAVYGALLRAPRRDWHARAAEWFAVVGDAAARAGHLESAEDRARAVAAYLDAAQDRAAAGQFEAVLPLARRGLALAPEGHARFELQVSYAEAARRLGRMDEAIVAFRAAMEAASTSAERGRAWFGLAAAARVMGPMDTEGSPAGSRARRPLGRLLPARAGPGRAASEAGDGEFAHWARLTLAPS